MGFFDLPVVSLLFKNARSIQEISGYITLSENTKDELEITQHPVEQGATITDHSFKKPTILSMQIQFDRTNLLSTLSNPGSAGKLFQGPLTSIASDAVTGLVSSNSEVLAQTYEKLLNLQDSREPFDISTPKRLYEDMLFQSLGLVTDKNTENVLSISATFQEIIIVESQNAIVPRSLQKLPGKTGKTQKAGKKSGLKVLSTGVSALFGG